MQIRNLLSTKTIFCIFVMLIFCISAQANDLANYQLFKSIEALDVNGVQNALSKGADPNATHPEYDTHYKYKALNMVMDYYETFA